MSSLSTNPASTSLPGVLDQGHITGPAVALRMRARFLHWWHTTLECLVSTQKVFRRFKDDDITILYLAAWYFALEELSELQKPTADDRIVEFMTRLDASQLKGATLTQFADVTGIPRETVRRKLGKATSLLILDRLEDARFRLCAFSTDILPIFDHCLGLGRSVLGCLSTIPVRSYNPTAPDWLSLMRAYLALLLSSWSDRRKLTRVSSAVSVQSAIELVTVLNSYRHLAIAGELSRIDLETFLANAPTIRQSPYFIAHLASISGLPVRQVRNMCRYLEAQHKLEFLGADAIRPLPVVNEMSIDLQQAYFSESSRANGIRFVGVALACLLNSTSVDDSHA